MSVTIKEKDLLFIVVNVITILSAIIYYILFYTIEFTVPIIGSLGVEGTDAATMAMILFRAFAALIFGMIIIITAVVDMWGACRFAKKRNRGWL